MEYKKIGPYIRQVDVRNRDLSVNNLLGVSIEKRFIPSIANIIGTDLSSYKIVKSGQFAYGPVTSRNGEKVSIALLSGPDCIISSSYSVFEVTDTSALDPEYLMLWFQRPEFDRYARFHSHGSVREIFDWDSMCEVKIPFPPIDVQRELVYDYKVISDRIALKRRINENLIAIATTLISKEMGVAALVNKTQEEMDAIPLRDNWSIQSLSEYCLDIKSGGTPSRSVAEYWDNGQIPWLKSGEVHNNVSFQTEELITQTAVDNSAAKMLPAGTVLMAMYGVTAGEVGFLEIPATTNQAVCGMICKSRVEAAYLFFALIQNQLMISKLSNGGAQDNLSKNFIEQIKLIVPETELLCKLGFCEILNSICQNTKEILVLSELKDSLLLGHLYRMAVEELLQAAKDARNGINVSGPFRTAEEAVASMLED